MRDHNLQWIRIAQLVDVTQSEGPGRRFAIWFQGCPMRCPGCCNPEMLSFEGGQLFSQSQLRDRLSAAVSAHQIEGVTLLGGEPFAHAEAAAWIATEAASLELSVMAFSGYTLKEITQLDDSWSMDLFSRLDVLVDGRYDQSQHTTARRWIGSLNQGLHFLTDRYSPEDPCWTAPNTVEFRIENDELIISGFPAKQTNGAIRRWERTTR